MNRLPVAVGFWVFLVTIFGSHELGTDNGNIWERGHGKYRPAVWWSVIVVWLKA